MLATLTHEPFSREGWLFEPKWDGERCLVFRRGRDLSLFSRNQKRLNNRYPEITAAFDRQETRPFIADGEIVTFEDGITSFVKLQQRIQIEHPSADLLRRVPVRLCLLICSTWITTTPGRFRSSIARTCFATPSTSRIRCSSPSSARGRARPMIDRHAGELGGRNRKKCGKRLRLRENARLAQIQVLARTGIRDRRLHGCATQPDRLRSLADGLLS